MAGDVETIVIEKVSRLAAEVQAKNATAANAIQMVRTDILLRKSSIFSFLFPVILHTV
jgi:hypothetical protein